MPWHIYILECKDSKLYTGITKDLARRLRQHKSGNGCRFTKYRTPVILRYSEGCRSRPQALRREAAIKRLPREKKILLIESGKETLPKRKRIKAANA